MDYRAHVYICVCVRRGEGLPLTPWILARVAVFLLGAALLPPAVGSCLYCLELLWLSAPKQPVVVAVEFPPSFLYLPPALTVPVTGLSVHNSSLLAGACAGWLQCKYKC